MATEAAAPPATPQVRRPWWKNGRRWCGVILLGLAAAYLVAAAWIGPRQNPFGEPFHIDHDAAVVDDQPRRAHELAWWQDDIVDQLRPTAGPDVSPGSTTIKYVIWDGLDGHLVWTSMRSDDPRLKEFGQHVRAGESRPEQLMRWVTYPATALAIYTFVVIVAGERPRTGTRWYWFWLCMSPLCLGVIWFALKEKMRDPAEPRPRRKTGLDGFGTSIGAYVAVVIAFAALGGL
ncbi:hypothetical protein [Luteipulveratus halotolerans]|uniref:Uncharacterized protein n=1 Tax=Luteipulveratus halotolerans TaxID=1631356 RepID=A0A0L6CDX4_9MICO|nr:hypothetical protein [Luteipulveratus halotolerans]KNX36071.1 hypothetical protein VV01_01155 [Luteipulveratus halotolerans]